MNAPDPTTLRQVGIAALQAGDAASARRCFEQIAGSGQADAAVLIGQAMACERLGDSGAACAAVDRALELDPSNLHGLIMKGDQLARAGNSRAAVSYYGAATALSKQMPNLPPGLADSIRRAEEAHSGISKQIEKHLRRRLTIAGYDEERSSARFTRSMELLTGKRRLFLQQPRAFLFAELPHREFYPREDFPWLDAVEAATHDICAELTDVLQADDAFVPYIQRPVTGPVRPHKLLDNPAWSASFLWKDGALTPGAAQCPKTLAALAAVPLDRIRNRAPSVLFSLLKPGAHIPPHHGFLNSRLICHLPLIASPGCFLRVGNEVRQWEKGKAWVFDDTIEHEAWNSSDETRVILIFDVWRPELTEEERGLVAALWEAVDTFDTVPAERWSD